MRMWFISPKKLCRQHLLGEHVECHMFAGTLRKKISVQGYIDGGLFIPSLLPKRHELIAEEMHRRGMCHNSPLQMPSLTDAQKNVKLTLSMVRKSRKDLFTRCKECAERNDK